ncbi:hypothetical protein H0H81_000969 [Sphagnurus paluster]|uniref:Uncharacterized protein n=1 Tax=Sphagnurus paluster TaxID=117069 RepID=A0A9P7GUH7_9AGAR|nr:hypothetical protein H0H81_000969 [Sphagnurus paluster]
MSRAGLWELCSGVLAQNNPDKSLTFHRLPSLYRSIEEKEWTLEGFGFPLRDFGMDPSQDLLVLVEASRRIDTDTEQPCRIHLRSLSTGKPHSMAQNPVIICDVQKVNSPRDISHTIQVLADFLGILFSYSDVPENELYIWDWKTGMVETSLMGDDVDSFVFMSRNEVMVALLGVSLSEELAPILLTVDFKKETRDKHLIAEVEHGISFRYPRFHSQVGMVKFEIRLDPVPTLGSQKVPYYLAQNNRVFAACLSIVHDNRLKTIMLLAPLSTFRSALEDLTDDQITVDWSAWGHTGARVLTPGQNPSDVWVCYVSGSKYVALRKMSRSATPLVDVYDFYQPALLRNLSKPIHGIDYVTSPNFFEAGDIFAEEVQTSLPYTLQTLHLTDSKFTQGMAVMCTEDNIIVVDVRNNPESFILHASAHTL